MLPHCETSQQAVGSNRPGTSASTLLWRIILSWSRHSLWVCVLYSSTTPVYDCSAFTLLPQQETGTTSKSGRSSNSSAAIPVDEVLSLLSCGDSASKLVKRVLLPDQRTDFWRIHSMLSCAHLAIWPMVHMQYLGLGTGAYWMVDKHLPAAHITIANTLPASRCPFCRS